MQAYDIIMLIVLLVAIAMGYRRGLAWQVASISAIFVSYIVAVRFRDVVASRIEAAEPWNTFLAMLILYVASSFVIWMVFRMVKGGIDHAKLKDFDQQLGAILGAVKGVVLCIVITFFAVTLLGDTQKEQIIHSRSGYFIARLLDNAHGVMPRELDQVLGPYLDRLDQQLEPGENREDSEGTLDDFDFNFPSSARDESRPTRRADRDSNVDGDLSDFDTSDRDEFSSPRRAQRDEDPYYRAAKSAMNCGSKFDQIQLQAELQPTRVTAAESGFRNRDSLRIQTARIPAKTAIPTEHKKHYRTLPIGCRNGSKRELRVDCSLGFHPGVVAVFDPFSTRDGIPGYLFPQSTFSAESMTVATLELGPECAGVSLSADEFDAADFERGWRYELINGVLVVSPSPNPQERGPNEMLGHLLINYRETHARGSSLNATLPEHDINVGSQRRRADRAIWTGLGRQPRKNETPTILVEFVSAGKRNMARDYEDKRKEYAGIGVKEYWVVNRFLKTLTVFYADGTKTAFDQKKTYKTNLLPGFQLKIAKLLAVADEWDQ